MTLLVVSTQFRLQIYIVKFSFVDFFITRGKDSFDSFSKVKSKNTYNVLRFQGKAGVILRSARSIAEACFSGICARAYNLLVCSFEIISHAIYKVLDICDIEGNHVDISLSNTIHLVHFHLTHDSLSATYHINIQCNNRTLF